MGGEGLHHALGHVRLEGLLVLDVEDVALRADTDRDELLLHDLGPSELPAAMMNPAEVATLKDLIAEVVGNVHPELAAIRLAKVQAAGFDKISFYWVGGLTATRAGIYYFRIQGPTFIFEHNIEWENHIHSAWRDFDGDFGEDLLQLHLKMYPHKSAALYQDGSGPLGR